jgi:SsrA-binding protein
MGVKLIASNRRARFDYEVQETFEAGLVLLGSEVKSLRNHGASIAESFATIKGSEAWVSGMHIAPYSFARDGGHDPLRPRKLLLHRREIERISARVAERGLTLVPLRLYFRKGKAKLELALAKGRTKVDKRHVIREREERREMERGVRRVGRRLEGF